MKEYKLIPEDAVINMKELTTPYILQIVLQIKAIDRDEYNYFAGEFTRVKMMIEAEGGNMLQVEFHPEIN